MFNRRPFLSSLAAAAALAMAGLGFGNRTLEQRLNPADMAIDIRGMGGGRPHKFKRRWLGKPTRRLSPAREGGNWQGTEYITYAEHDLATMLRVKHNRTAGTLMQMTQEEAVKQVVAAREARVEERLAARRAQEQSRKAKFVRSE